MFRGGMMGFINQSVNSYYNTYSLFTVYLQLYTRHKPRPYAIQCYSYPVVTIYGTRNIIFHYKPFALYSSTSRSMCTVLSVALLFSSWTSCFPDALLRYFLSDFQMVPVDPIVTGNILVLHSTCAVFLL